MESPIEQIKDTSQLLQPNFICHEIHNYEDFVKYGQNGCGHPMLSQLFFLSFHIVYTYSLISLLIGVIVDAYSDEKKQ